MSEETTDRPPVDAHASASDDEQGHAPEALGPIDWQKWAFAVAGGVAGLIILVFFYAAIS